MITLDLPITQPTGKVRVKKRLNNTDYGVPVAIAESNPNAKNITDDLYVEWQISYDTPNQGISELVFYRKNKKNISMN